MGKKEAKRANNSWKEIVLLTWLFKKPKLCERESEM